MQRHVACVVGVEHDERRSLALVAEMVARPGTRERWKYAADAAAAGAAGKVNSKIICNGSLYYITTIRFSECNYAFGRQFLSKTTHNVFKVYI